MKTLFYASAAALLAASVSGAQAHTLKTATCNASFAQGEALLNIVVQNGAITGTGGASGKAFTARVQPDGTVNFYRPDGTLWYRGVRMSGGSFYATYFKPGGGGIPAAIPCTERTALSN